MGWPNYLKTDKAGGREYNEALLVHSGLFVTCPLINNVFLRFVMTTVSDNSFRHINESYFCNI